MTYNNNIQNLINFYKFLDKTREIALVGGLDYWIPVTPLKGVREVWKYGSRYLHFSLKYQPIATPSL